MKLGMFHSASKSHKNKEKPRQKPWFLWLRRQDSNLRPVAVPYIFGGGHSRLENIDRCHSLRQSTSHNVTFSASGKFQLCLGFSSPHKAGFAGPPVISFFVCFCGSISSLRISVINSNKAFSVSTAID